MDKNECIEPILEINEFEEASGAILDLAKDQAVKIIQGAKERAADIVKKEKETFAAIEKEYLEQTDIKLATEKKGLIKKADEEIARIKNISDEKIKQTANYILEKIIPR